MLLLEDDSMDEMNNENPLLDKKYCYHGIGGAVFRLPSILEHGILPPSYIKSLNMPENYDSKYSYNGPNQVSVIMSPQFCDGPDTLGGDYSEGITFVCETDYWRGLKAQESGIPYEAHTSRISPDKIKGVILPESFFNKPIKDCGNLFGGYGQYGAICEAFTRYMKEECGYETSGYDIDLRLMNASKDPSNRDKFRDKLNAHLFSDLQQAIDKKLGKKNSTFVDIVNFYIKDKPNIKLYNRETLQKEVTRSDVVKVRRSNYSQLIIMNNRFRKF